MKVLDEMLYVQSKNKYITRKEWKNNNKRDGLVSYECEENK